MIKNNKGFSYVEMILVLGIIAIMMGIIALSTNLIGRTNVNKGCDNLNNALTQARTATMAKGNFDCAMSIFCEDGKYYYYIGDPYSTERSVDKIEFASLPVNITYTIKSAPGIAYTLGEGDVLVVEYYATSGAFSLSDLPDGAPVDMDFIETISFVHKDKMCSIRCYPATGKTVIE